MKINLVQQLSDAGYDRHADDYRVAVLEIAHALQPDWTDEEILYHPDIAKELCRRVNNETGVTLEDHVILRTLVNCRKRGFGIDQTT